MRLCCDNNLFVAVLTNEADHAEIARTVLNSDHTLVTPVLTLMELRTVLMKKAQFERAAAEEAEQRIRAKVTVTTPDAATLTAADTRQRESLLYPMDALILAAANAADATLVSFDSELQSHGAIAPDDIE